jgi:hypothetical protein
MIKPRNHLRIMSIFFALALLAWPGAALAQTSSITYTSADFGDVVVDTKAVKIVTVTYTGEGIFNFNWLLESDSCGFTVTGDRGQLYQDENDPDKASTEITIEWIPLAPGQCSANLKIRDKLIVAVNVPLTGNGVSEVPQEEPSGMQSLLDAFDTWVASEDIVGKGPGKSADNRRNAFRNMLVEAKLLVEQERNAEAYGQLMAAKKKIGEFITDSNSVNIAAASSTSATGSLEHLMDKVLESLLQ